MVIIAIITIINIIMIMIMFITIFNILIITTVILLLCEYLKSIFHVPKMSDNIKHIHSCRKDKLDRKSVV